MARSGLAGNRFCIGFSILNELAEARKQQAATAEILRVISSALMDLQHTFAEIAASATRLWDASDATSHQVDGDVLRLVTHHGPTPIPGSLLLRHGVLANVPSSRVE
jgi:adenylate cyclase